MSGNINSLTLFAETYNCGAYGQNNYNENSCVTTSSGTDNSASLSAPSTGLSVEAGGGIAAGLALIVLAFVIFRSGKKKKQS
jgi:LPXTG-motif cell wall-anchored protein